MSMVCVSPAVALEEPVVIAPVYCSGLATVQHIDGALHFVLFANQPSTLDPGRVERVVNLRFIMPLDGVAHGLPPVIATLAAAMAGKMFSPNWIGHA